MVPVNNSNFSQFALLIGGGCTLMGALVGQAVNWFISSRKHNLDAAVAKTTEISALAGAGNELIGSLLAERASLLNQLLAERRFYEEKISHLEKLFDSRNIRLEDRINQLEKDNLAKDKTILEQQAQINEQKLRIDAQERLITVLQSGEHHENPSNVR